MTKMPFFLNFLCLAVLDLSCCTQDFSSWGEQGYFLVAVHGLLVVVSSLIMEHRF